MPIRNPNSASARADATTKRARPDMSGQPKYADAPNEGRLAASAIPAMKPATKERARDRTEIEHSRLLTNEAFEYSNEEWAKIELCVQAARSRPLTEERRRLQQAAVEYSLRSSTRELLKLHERRFLANRESIRWLAANLYQALSEVQARNHDNKYGRLLQSLAKLRDDKSISAAKRPPFSQLSPREDYYREILGVWVDMLGGALSYSRDADNKVRGPLIRFFQAVTCPVLATDAPALESISDIVDREKERRKKRRKKGGQAPAQMVRSIEEPMPRPDASGWYTDLGQFRTDPVIPFDLQVHDYVVERGRATGVRHIIAVNAEGTVLAHGYGTHNGFALPMKLSAELENPANKIVIHHNHPTSAGLNIVDIAFLAAPGLEAICVHGHGGYVARGALTSKGRAMLQALPTGEAMAKLYRIANGVGEPFIDVLWDAIAAGRISHDQASQIHCHHTGLALARDGILDYQWKEARPHLRHRRDRSQDGQKLTRTGPKSRVRLKR
jgi:hypothetical protein